MRNININRKLRRKRRISTNIFGTKDTPRISVFRSNKYTYAQAINDKERGTLGSFSSLTIIKNKEYKKVNKLEEAREVGRGLAKILKEKKIKIAIFDRGIYAYKGRVKAVAEGLREGGITI